MKQLAARFVFSLLILAAVDIIKADPVTYKVSMAKLPWATECEQKGVAVEILRLWEKQLGVRFDIHRYPFKRSLFNVINRRADFHIPLIKNPDKDEKELAFDYSTSALGRVNFILYTNKHLSIVPSNLHAYKVYTDASHVELFTFPIQADYTIENSLRKLDSGRIDAYIFAEKEVDPILKKLGLKNIRRQLYKVFDVHAVLPKGEKGGKVDQMITKGMQIIKKNGQWADITKPVHGDFDNWQP